MAAKRRPKTDAISPTDAMPADLRRDDLPETRPDDLPEIETGPMTDDVVEGGFTPKPDGGVDQHPIHDEDQEDAEPSDYEREIDRLDAAVRSER
jgi:hypothetical protein